MHLVVMGLAYTIVEGNPSSSQNSTKAMTFLFLHLHNDLKVKYLTVKDLLIL
jgi:hypothetical protein